MMGPRLRLALRIAAWAVIGFAPVTVAVTVAETLMGAHTVLPEGQEWRFFLSLVYGAALPMVQGGILLVLISIDERIERKGEVNGTR